MTTLLNLENYNQSLSSNDIAICELLAKTINSNLTYTDNKVWHSHPVWFIDGNPIVGFSKEKKGIRLMFWSGAGFEESNLSVRGKKFKDASIYYNSISEIDAEDIKRWLQKAEIIQWDYKNIVKRKGELVRLK